MNTAFAIWSKENVSSHEKILGICVDYQHAVELAKRLYTIKKKIDGEVDIATGYFVMDVGNLYTSEKPIYRQVMPLLTTEK